jgi:hypothetical protein
MKSILVLGLALLIGAGIYEYYATRNSPVVRAQQLSMRLQVEAGAEYDRLAAKRHKREMDAYEQKHGRAARSRREDAYAQGYWGMNSTNVAHPPKSTLAENGSK